MLKRFRAVMFRLWEQASLRNWFFTLAYAIFVPTGFRFAYVAWRSGAWFDKPLAIVAGTMVGMTTVATLLRFWEVPPQQTVPRVEELGNTVIEQRPEHTDVLSASRHEAALRRSIAREAASLGLISKGPMRPRRY